MDIFSTHIFNKHPRLNIPDKMTLSGFFIGSSMGQIYLARFSAKV